MRTYTEQEYQELRSVIVAKNQELSILSEKLEEAQDVIKHQSLSILNQQEKYNALQEEYAAFEMENMSLKSRYIRLEELQQSTATVNYTLSVEKTQAEDKLAKMELMYDKLANIHSKQEEKYKELEAEYGVYVKVSYEQEGELRAKYNKLLADYETLELEKDPYRDLGAYDALDAANLKYNRLKEFAANIVDYRDNSTALQLHITALKLLLEAGLKEQ